MLPLLASEDAVVEPRTLYWQHENHAAVREGNWKLVTNNDRDPASWELYDLTADRSETEDLSEVHPEMVRRLMGKWRRWAEQVNAIPYPEQRDEAQRIPWPPRAWPE